MPIQKKKRLTGIQKVVDAVPGKKYFGVFRFLPVFFFIGAGLEFAMIHWKPNGHNFCKCTKLIRCHNLTLFHSPDHTYKKRRAKDIIEEEYLARIAVEASSKK